MDSRTATLQPERTGNIQTLSPERTSAIDPKSQTTLPTTSPDEKQGEKSSFGRKTLDFFRENPVSRFLSNKLAAIDKKLENSPVGPAWVFLRKKFTGTNAWGSVAVGVQIGFSRRLQITQGFERTKIDVSKLSAEDIAAGKAPGVDWTRVVGGMVAGVNDAAFFASDREGNVPKGDNAVKRILTAMLHPKQYPHHARAAFGCLVASPIGILGGLYYSKFGLSTEKTRYWQAVVSVPLMSLQMWSMFKAPVTEEQKALKDSQKAAPFSLITDRTWKSAYNLVTTASKENINKVGDKMESSRIAPVQWIGFALKQQFGLVVAAVMELSLKGLELYEGVEKKRGGEGGKDRNEKEGKTAINRSLINAGLVISNFGYTAQKLKHKADAGNVKKLDADTTWLERTGSKKALDPESPWSARHMQSLEDQRERAPASVG